MVSKYAVEYSTSELLACFLAREIEDGEEVAVGAGMPIPRAAVLLAHLTHGPNITCKLAYTRTNLLNIPVMESFEYEADNRQTRWAENIYSDDDIVVSMKRRMKTRYYVGAIQIDKFGNSNLLGIGDDYKRLKLRGAGAVGTTYTCDHTKCFYLLANSHDKRIFVEKCDFITVFGWGQGGADARKKLGLPGGGPKYCLTPICIMDFEEETKRMRLKSVHPGVTPQQVAENTGFQLVIPPNVPNTEPPTEDEIKLLRTRIDVEGLLRR